MAPSMKAQLRKTYGRSADIVYEEKGHSGNRYDHFLVLHKGGEAVHRADTGKKLTTKQAWPATPKKKKSKLSLRRKK